MNEEEKLREATKIMQKFKEQTNAMGGMTTNAPMAGTNEFDNQGGDFAEYGQGNEIGMGFDNQNQPEGNSMINNPTPVSNPMSNQIMPINTPPTPTAPAPGRSDVCPQCKTMHPPLRPGEKCPNVNAGKELQEAGIDDAVVHKHLVDLRNIIFSQMSSKHIKDGKKFFQHIVVELMKVMESYTE